MSTEIKRIDTQAELIALARELGVRDDWHEPDEQGLRALIFGNSFDNAGHWGLDYLGQRQVQACKRLWNPKNTLDGGVIENPEDFCEIFIVLYRNDNAIAEINLATLFAFACGTCSD